MIQLLSLRESSPTPTGLPALRFYNLLLWLPFWMQIIYQLRYRIPPGFIMANLIYGGEESKAGVPQYGSHHFRAFSCSTLKFTLITSAQRTRLQSFLTIWRALKVTSQQNKFHSSALTRISIKLNYIIIFHTTSTEQNNSSEANSCSVSQEIPVFQGARVSITIFTRAWHQAPFPSQMNPIHSLPFHLFVVYFNNILPFRLGLQSGLSVSISGSSLKTFLCICFSDPHYISFKLKHSFTIIRFTVQVLRHNSFITLS